MPQAPVNVNQVESFRHDSTRNQRPYKPKMVHCRHSPPETTTRLMRVLKVIPGGMKRKDNVPLYANALN